MSKPPITLPDRIADAYFCEDDQDFHKMILGHIKVVARDADDALFLTTGIRVICHEYLALVCSGKFTPYEMPKEWVNNNRDDFKEMIHLVNELIVGSGVPTYEGEGGRVRVDTDKLDEMMKERFENGEA